MSLENQSLRIQVADLHEEVRKLTAKNQSFRKEIAKLSKANESFQDLPFLFDNSIVGGGGGPDAFSNRSIKTLPRTNYQNSVTSSARRDDELLRLDSALKKNPDNALINDKLSSLELELSKERKVCFSRFFSIFYLFF